MNHEHVVNRGHNREVVFRAKNDDAYFLHLLERYRERSALRHYYCCLMRNHFHLLVDCENARDLSPYITVRDSAEHKPEALAKGFASASGLFSNIAHGHLDGGTAEVAGA